MEKQIKLSQSVLIVALATGLILMVPLVAMQFSNEVDWKLGDFIFMGALLFSSGFSYVLVTRFMNNLIYKLAVGAALGSTLFMIWANLAVGLIGSGPNPGNLMYLVVLAVGIIATSFSRLTPAGMERAMYSMALAFVLVAVIALFSKMDQYPGSSALEIVGINGFFAVLYAVSGLLFRAAGQKQSQAS